MIIHIGNYLYHYDIFYKNSFHVNILLRHYWLHFKFLQNWKNDLAKDQNTRNYDGFWICTISRNQNCLPWFHRDPYRLSTGSYTQRNRGHEINGRRPRVQEIMSDFEYKPSAEMKIAFPGVSVRGCGFHWVQTVKNVLHGKRFIN